MVANDTFKARITTSLGEFEFEGSQAYVESQIDRVLALQSSKPLQSPRAAPKPGSKGKPATSRSGTASSPKKATQNQPKVMNDLVPKAKVDDLKRFVEDKKPKGHLQTYAVLGYFLKENLGISEIGVDEMWTLYKVLHLRPPKVPIQVLRDARSRHSHFESVGEGRYFLTSIGETFVEHDLPETTGSK